MLKLLLDENIGKIVAEKLREYGYDVASVLEVSPGAGDEAVLAEALKEERILVTLDRDFGRLIFLNSRKHTGVIYLRLSKESPRNILRSLLTILEQHGEKVRGRFVTVTEDRVRIR